MLKQARRWVGWLAGLLLWPTLLGAQTLNEIEYDDLDDRVEVSTGLVHLMDEFGDLSFQQVMRPPLLGRWQPLPEDVPNLGWNEDAAHWFGFRAVYRGGREVDRRYLEIAYPLLDRLAIYVNEDGHYPTQYSLGDKFPFHDRLVEHRQFLLPLLLHPNRPLNIYIRVQSTSSIQIPISLISEQAYLEQDQRSQAWHGLYFGIMLVMVCYNLFLFAMIRDLNYLLYCASVASIALFQAAFHGFGFQYLWPDYPAVQQWVIPFSVALASASFTYFSLHFLNLKQRFRVSHWLMHGVAAYFLLIAALSLWLPNALATRLAASGSVLLVLLALPLGVLVWFRGYTPARYYTLAFVGFLVGTLALALNKFGLIERSFFTENGQQIGSALEVVLLSFALAARINLLRRERAALINQRHQELEQQVQQRTEDLNHAMRHLEQANRQLTALSTEDGLTHAKNRRYFEERLGQEWKRGQRTGAPLSLLLLDIDHFKQLNDNHGHLVGDDCLIALVSLLHDTLRDAQDGVCRYGGEEFAVLLPDTSIDSAEVVAERILQSVRALVVNTSNGPLRMTVSIGVVSRVAHRDQAYQTLVAAADTALYQAKALGRDRCVLESAATLGRPPLSHSS